MSSGDDDDYKHDPLAQQVSGTQEALWRCVCGQARLRRGPWRTSQTRGQGETAVEAKQLYSTPRKVGFPHCTTALGFSSSDLSGRQSPSPAAPTTLTVSVLLGRPDADHLVSLVTGHERLELSLDPRYWVARVRERTTPGIRSSSYPFSAYPVATGHRKTALCPGPSNVSFSQVAPLICLATGREVAVRNE